MQSKVQSDCSLKKKSNLIIHQVCICLTLFIQNTFEENSFEKFVRSWNHFRLYVMKTKNSDPKFVTITLLENILQDRFPTSFCVIVISHM